MYYNATCKTITQKCIEVFLSKGKITLQEKRNVFQITKAFSNFTCET